MHKESPTPEESPVLKSQSGGSSHASSSSLTLLECLSSLSCEDLAEALNDVLDNPCSSEQLAKQEREPIEEVGRSGLGPHHHLKFGRPTLRNVHSEKRPPWNLIGEFRRISTDVDKLSLEHEQLQAEREQYRKQYLETLERCALLERGIIAGRKAERYNSATCYASSLPGPGAALELAPAFWQQTLQQQDTQQRLAANVFRAATLVNHAPPL